MGIRPDVYYDRWAEFERVVEYTNVKEPFDQALLWREMTGTAT